MFAHPLGLLALLAVPAIVALHLYRRRFAPRTVSALFLWTDPDTTPLSGRKRDPLRSSISLWCEIAAAVALALALASPRGCAGRAGEHWVVVVDGSASMGTVVDAPEPADPAAERRARAAVLDHAREAIRERIADLPRGSRVTIVQSGPRPRLVAGPAAFPVEATRALDTLSTTALAHDLVPATAMGLQLSGGGAVTCYTDTFRPDELPPEVEVVALGRATDNVALVHAARELSTGAERGTDRVVLTIANASSSAVSTRVEARLAQAPRTPVLEPRTVELAPRERKVFAFEVARDAQTIEVRLAGDALAIDDVAWLAPRPARVVGVRASVSDENAALLGLSSRTSRIGRWLGALEDAVEATSDETAHVLVADRAAGGPDTWTLRTDVPTGERRDFVGPFLADRRHPLLEGTTLEGIVWSADPKWAPRGVPLVSAGNSPLVVEERTGARREYALTIDPARSTLARSPDWPILLANLVEARRAELPGATPTNLVVGDTATWRGRVAADDARPFVLTGPGGAREYLPRGTLVLDGFDRPGAYELSRPDSGVVATFGVSYSDARESDVTTLSSGARAATVGIGAAPPRASWLEIALAALAVLALLVDWFVLQRIGGRVAAATRRVADDARAPRAEKVGV